MTVAGKSHAMDMSIFDAHGILLRRQAVLRGLDDDWLGRMVRNQTLVRMRQGAYADAEVWATASRAQRHALLARAVMQQYDDRIALSHVSAVILRGGPDWGLDLSSVHVTNLFGRGDRSRAGVTHHRGDCRVGDVSRVEGHWLSSPARAAVETSLISSRDPAIAVLDWTLSRGLATREQYEVTADRLIGQWPHSTGLRAWLDLSGNKSDSVGETRTKLFLHDHRLPVPEQQWEVFHPDGRLAGVVDFALHRERVMIEFDGMIKYGRLLKPGQTINDVILRERAREKTLEELTGYWMMRIVWADLADQAALNDRIRRVISSSAARHAG